MREWDSEIWLILNADRQFPAINAEEVKAMSLLQGPGVGYPPGLFQRKPLSRERVLFFKPEVATVTGLADGS